MEAPPQPKFSPWTLGDADFTARPTVTPISTAGGRFPAALRDSMEAVHAARPAVRYEAEET